MADEHDRPESGETSPEPSHFPGPSIWPFGFALGVAVALVGLIVSWPAAAVGVAIAVVFGILWIREATRELRAAPEPEPPRAEVATEDEDEDEADEHHYTRNVFLAGATLGLGAAIGAVVTLPVIGFAVIPAFVGQESDPVDLGPLDGYPEGQWMVTKFNLVPDEPEAVVARSAYIRNNGQMSDGQPSFTILSNRCVHLGCPVQPTGLTEENKEIETKAGKVQLASTAPSGFTCPCHGGAYDLEGNRVAGPPVRALDRYTYSIVDGNLMLGQLFSVGEVEGTGADAEMQTYKHQDPGTHVDGPEQYFYPYVP
jgi:menaquinol-cytochrome c reductase iron-sulfur subunit